MSTQGRHGATTASVSAEAGAGLTAALVSIPVGIGYGVFAFSPLGPDYYSHGVMAGLYCTLIMSTVALATGSRAPLLYGPRNMVAFMVNALVLHILVDSHAALLARLPSSQVVAVVMLLGLMAGAMQLLLGVLRAGAAVKYVPHPVIAGFQCAAGLLLILGQADAVFGLRQQVRLSELATLLPCIDPWSLLVAVITLTACLARVPRLSRLPALAVGGTVGTLAFYLLHFLIPAAPPGLLLGAMPGGLPLPHYAAELQRVLGDAEVRALLPALLIGAASIALIGSLDTLLGGKALAGGDRASFRGNRELARIGAGNMLGALFGAVPGAIALASSIAGQRAGGRTRLYCVVHLALIAGAVLLLPGVLAMIPRAVIGGMLIAVGIGLLDRWTVQQLARALRDGPQALRGSARDLSIVGLVALLAVAIDIVVAVAMGVAVSVIYFILRMSRSVIRRSYRCAWVRSRRSRPEAQARRLSVIGERIVAFELEGAIFFGTAEDLANRIEMACTGTPTIVIVDIARVSEIDLSGSRILSRAADLLINDGNQLVISGLKPGSELDRYLDAAGTRAALSSERIFPDLDRALEWAEDRLLLDDAGAAAHDGTRVDAALDLANFELFDGLTEAQLALLRAAMTLRRYGRGERLFDEGDPGDTLYLVVSGSASAWLRGRSVRLVTFSAGSFVGELAMMIDLAPRTAAVFADDALTCLELKRAKLDRIAAESPELMIRITANLCRELSHRLRRTNRTLVELSR